MEAKAKSDGGKLSSLRKKIQATQMILIIATIVLMSVGGMIINISANEKNFEKELQNSSTLITHLYGFIKDYSQDELRDFLDMLVRELPDVDAMSVVDKNGIRRYHTNHSLINTRFDGEIPDFSNPEKNFYTENSIGPSGPQIRTYSVLRDEDGNYDGFILPFRLRTSVMSVTTRTVALFLSATFLAILIELLISRSVFKSIKKEFLDFTEDFEGTKFLVDSMRANNHDFTNKLHVILGLIQIGEYEKATNYIENISIIQRETVSRVMNSIENPSFAALVIGKIARASECNVKFVLQDGICFREKDISVPSEALVTITGNLIDNALDSMNHSSVQSSAMDSKNELTFGVFTKPGELLITVKDTGCGIPEENISRIFQNGFSTKGEGRGVGLYHTRQLVESLGGTVSVESQAGRGASFMVRLKR